MGETSTEWLARSYAAQLQVMFSARTRQRSLDRGRRLTRRASDGRLGWDGEQRRSLHVKGKERGDGEGGTARSITLCVKRPGDAAICSPPSSLRLSVSPISVSQAPHAHSHMGGLGPGQARPDGRGGSSCRTTRICIRRNCEFPQVIRANYPFSPPAEPQRAGWGSAAQDALRDRGLLLAACQQPTDRSGGGRQEGWAGDMTRVGEAGRMLRPRTAVAGRPEVHNAIHTPAWAGIESDGRVVFGLRMSSGGRLSRQLRKRDTSCHWRTREKLLDEG